MNSPIKKEADGSVTWDHQEGDTYLATGINIYGERFRISNTSWRYISQINLYRGNKWLYRKGKRYLLQRTIN